MRVVFPAEEYIFPEFAKQVLLHRHFVILGVMVSFVFVLL